MRITRLHIKNFRSIREITLDLSRVTLLVGPNGAGKSNIIDAIQFMADALTMGLDSAIGRRDGIDAIRRRTAVAGGSRRGRPVEVTIEVRLEETVLRSSGGRRRRTRRPRSRTPGYGFVLGARAGGDWYVKEEWAAHGKTLVLHRREGELKVAPDHIDEDAVGDQDLLAPLLGSALGFPLRQALTTCRRFDISPAALRAPQPFGQTRALEPDGSNLNHVWSALQSERPETAARIVELLSQVLPGLESIDALTAGRYKALQAVFRLPDGKAVTVDGAGLSDGSLRALALLVAVHPSTPMTLIAVEEPEKALHPYASELLFDALLSAPEAPPLLMSTHSPAILTSRRFDLSMLRVVEWRDGHTVAGPVAEDVRQDVADHLTTAPDLLAENSLTPMETVKRHRTLRPSR